MPDEYATVAEHLERALRPGLSCPYAVTEPHTTADGTRVVVTCSVLDDFTGSARTALYSAQGGRLSAVTAAIGSARRGRFSPDGEALAFLSDRAQAGVFQLFLLHEGRFGEAVAAPPVPGTVEYAHWSPDGTRILLCVADLGAERSAGDGSGTNVSVGDDRSSWHPMIDDGVPGSAWRGLWLYSLVTGEVAKLSHEEVNCWEGGWCGPDQVVAVTSDAPGEDAWYDAELTLIDIRTGRRRRLLSGEGQLGLPAGSPDGRYASVVQAVCSDRGFVAGDLTVIDLASGEHAVVATAGTDVAYTQWIDAKRLGYVGQRHLDSVAGIVDVPGHAVAEVFSTPLSCGGGRYPDGAFTTDGRIVVVRSAYDVPPHVALVDGDKAEILASAAHSGTDYLLSIAGTAQAVTWSAPDGLQIDGVLCTPPGDGPFPLVVNIHGGPIWAFRNIWSMNSRLTPLLVSQGYAVLNPNPRGSTGRGQDFARLVVGDMGGADAHDLLSGINTMVERGIADPTRIGLIGTSYGGFMASWLVTQDQRFAAAVPVSPITDWYSQSFTSNVSGWGTDFLQADPEQPGTTAHTRSPVLHASKVRTPCLNVAGANDRCTPPGQAREFHQALLAHGVESVLAVYPQEGHGVRAYPATIDFLARVLSWFHRHMPA